MLSQKKNVQSQWTTECQDAFDKLDQLLTTAPVLSYPQFGANSEFVLGTDASISGLGAVLGQKQEDSHVHPITYASRCLQPHETNYYHYRVGDIGSCMGREAI